VCPSFLTGDQHSLIQARLIDCVADSAERIEPLLATLALIEEVPDRVFDQFVAAPIVAVCEVRARAVLSNPPATLHS
jgi:hypothetical protein